MWTDLNGLSHGKYIPAHRMGNPTHHAITTMSMGLDGEILPIEGLASDVGFRDMDAIAVGESLRPGWEPDTDVVIAELQVDGRPLAVCPRQALVRAVDAWRALGFEPMLGFELEFYVLVRGDDAPGGWQPAGGPSHRVYGTGLGGDTTGLGLAYFDMVERMGLRPEAVHTEFSAGQMEVTLEYGRAVEATDRVFVCKEMTREVADQAGYRATYLGRPHATSVGSGLHINMSFLPVAGGPNALHDESTEHGLSSLAESCLAGLIAHHEAIAAFSAPLVNSYKRLMPGMIAGYWANWGLDNRFSTYRVPAERGASTRIENRMPCGSANPYLAAAAMLNAALIGTVDGLPCGDPQVGDADAVPNTDRHTPNTLAEALDALEADAALSEAMGHALTETYLTLRRYDNERYFNAGNQFSANDITEWELEQYLPYF
jgi:glutamine synthetase